MLVRSRFGKLDECGNVVRLWNFGKSDEVLREIDSPEQRKFGPVVLVSAHHPPFSHYLQSEVLTVQPLDPSIKAECESDGRTTSLLNP